MAIVFSPQVRNCATHGQWTQTSRFDFHCPMCEEAQRARQALERLECLVDISGTPPPYRSASLASLSAVFQPLSEFVDSYADENVDGPILIVGPPGTGKTHAACAALQHAIRKTGRTGTYVTASAYCRAIRATWSRGSDPVSESESSILRRYSRTDLLILDDLGAGRAHDVELVQELICERYAAGLMPCTIAITNFAATELDEVVGKRAADRLRQRATLVEALGASRRQPKARQDSRPTGA